MPADNLSKEFASAKQILEIKKKIQLSEGQRKARFEEYDAEKRKNNDKIRVLKKEIKEMYEKLSRPVKCEEVISRRAKSARSDLFSLRNKNPDQAITIIDYRIIDANKRLDLVKYQHRKLEEGWRELRDLYEQLMKDKAVKQAKESKTEKPPEKQRLCELENQIHHTELNAMEAETIRKKYRSIRACLLEDSVRFESALRQLETDIVKQEAEIRRLQKIKTEAQGVRNATRHLLQKQEDLAQTHNKDRDRKLQEHRHVVEERRLELEVLERRLFPTSGVPQLHRDSVTSLDNFGFGGQGEDGSHFASSALEEAFKKLMVATGEVESKLVTQRFIGQKETRSRLTYLRGITEEDKRKMEVTKNELHSQLESAKFAAEVKDKEQNLEGVENLKTQILEEDNLLKSRVKELEVIDKSTKQVTMFFRKMSCMLKDFGPPLPLNIEDVEAEEVLQLLTAKLTAVQEIAIAKEEERRLKEAASKSRGGSRVFVPALLTEQMMAAPQAPQKPQGTDSDEDEDIPTRGFLKRQAQIIVDAKSRRRFYRPSKHTKGKTPLHLRK